MSIPRIASYPLPAADDIPASKASWPFEPRRAVLLIHDMQRYFMDFYGDDSPLAAELIENVRRLRTYCTALGVPVVYTAQPSEQSAQDRALLNDMWGPGLTAADPALARITPQLEPSDEDSVLVKWRYSAFQRSPLEEKLQAWGRDQLVICGVYAHIGCLTTALDAFMRDVQPFIVADALGDFSRQEHLMALSYVAGRCGRVVDVQAIVGPPRTREAVASTLEAAGRRRQLGGSGPSPDHQHRVGADPGGYVAGRGPRLTQ
jgi:bifunctional isochorismate lyase/aryl carrier protein